MRIFVGIVDFRLETEILLDQVVTGETRVANPDGGGEFAVLE